MSTQNEEIAKMIENLKTLNALPHDNIASWESGYPNYHPIMHTFFLQVDEFWLDYDYVKNIENMTVDHMDTYGIAQLKTILTKVIRQERFSDGSWEHAMKSGVFIRIQERLVQLSNAEKDNR